jgi:pilus assembly protein CpaB
VSEFVERLSSSRLFSTRGGTIAVAIFAALLALLILLLYLSNYRDSVKKSSAPVPVLVAQRLIPKGTAGDLLGTTGGFQATEVAKSAVKEGALTDPAILKGRVAVTDIYPGQQLALTDFTPTALATLGSKLTGRQRAMMVPVDSVHGMIGTVVPGDRVDIYLSVNGIVTPILQNVLVLGVNGGGSSGIGSSNAASSLVIRTTPPGAARIAYASDNGDVWVILRPATRGGLIKRGAITQQSLLSGGKYVPGGDR